MFRPRPWNYLGLIALLLAVLTSHAKAPVKTEPPAKAELLHSIAWQDNEQGFPAHIFQTGVSENGKLFFGAGDAGPTGLIRIFEVATGKQIQELRPDKNAWFSYAAFVPGGKYLAAAYSHDKDLYLWDLVTGKVVRKFSGHMNPGTRLTVSPDGKRLLSWGPDETLRLWDVETGKELRQLEGHSEKSQGVFSPNGKTILTFSADKALRLWDTETGKELKKFEGDNKAVMGSFSSNGRFILAVSPDRNVRLWDVETGKELRRFEGAKDKVVGAEFVAWGRQVVARCNDQKLRVWNTATGKLLRELDLSTMGGAGMNIMASPDGRLGLVSREDASVRVIDLDNGKEIARYDRCPNAKSFSFTPNSNFAVGGSFRAGMYVFRLPRN